MNNNFIALHNQIKDLTNLVHKRTEEIIIRQNKLQSDINDIKLFLKTRLGNEPTNLKDILKVKLQKEKTIY